MKDVLSKKNLKNTILTENDKKIFGFAAYNKSRGSDDNPGEEYAIYILKDYH